MRSQLRAIFVEDDFLLAETLREGLESIGCAVLAQASNLRDGLQLAKSNEFDFAVVDIDLKGEMAFPLLDALDDRGIPFVIATGALLEDIPARHADAPRLPKPYDLQELRGVVANFTSQHTEEIR